MKAKKKILAPIKYQFVLLGDTSVGKSSIYHRLYGKPFIQNNISTIGLEKIIVNFENVQTDAKGKVTKDFEITLFDTAGQERFRSIAKSYFKGSQGIILIYSIVDKQSFGHIELWLNSIKDSLDDWKKSGYIVMLLGNKLDLANENANNRLILAEEAERVCSEKGIYWGGECSAKESSTELFIEIL